MTPGSRAGSRESKLAMKRGLDLAVAAAAGRLGPARTEVVFVGRDGTPVRGETAALLEGISLADPLEQLGAEVARDLAQWMREIAGDGVSTSAVMAGAIVDEALRAVAVGGDPAAIRRGIAKGVDAAVEDLKAQCTEVASKDDIDHVAAGVSRDREIGDVIADAFEKVGRDGAVVVEEGQAFGLELEFTEGMRFDKGYLSPYMVTDPERMETVLEEPYILVANKRIGPVSELLPVLEQVIQAGRPLLIVAEDVEGESLATLVVNKLRGTFTAVAVRAPGFGERRGAMLEDIAILTGGVLVAAETGPQLETVKLSELGRARKVIVNKSSTTIVDGAGDHDAIRARLGQLKTEIESADSDFEREKGQERLGKLAGGVAAIKVPGETELEMDARVRLTRDALSAAEAALSEGLLPGAGAALVRAAQTVRDLSVDERERPGAEAVANALARPAATIARNSGLAGDDVVARMLLEPGHGMDVTSGEWVELTSAGIVDGALTVRAALQNAAAAAERFLSMRVLTDSGPTAPGRAPPEASAAEELPLPPDDAAVDVVLADPGQGKIMTIKTVRALTGLGLREAKDLVDSAPTVLKRGVRRDEAESIKRQLEDAGAVVELK